MKVKDIMSKRVVTATAASAVREIWRKVSTAHVNALPIVDASKKLAGIIAKEDLLKAMYPGYQEYFEDITALEDFELLENKVKELGDRKASSIMCKRVIFTRMDTPIMRALSRMIVRNLNQLPVVDDRDMVVGMITKGDIFIALFKKSLKSVKKLKK